MTTTDKIKRIYAVKHGRPLYLKESQLLSDAKEFLQLIPDIKLIRFEAGEVHGVSDLLVCIEGKLVAIELKDNTGVASPQQLTFIADIHKSGGVAGIARNLTDVKNLLLEAVGASHGVTL